MTLNSMKIPIIKPLFFALAAVLEQAISAERKERACSVRLSGCG